MLQSSTLKMPSFLFGPYSSVHRGAMKEGRRCAGHYRKTGVLPAPRELIEVPPASVVILDKAVDLQREHPSWRLYMLSDVREGLHKALEWEDAPHVRDLYEAAFRETAWGALYYAASYVAPMDAGCIARRLKAVLQFWDALQSAQYRFNPSSASLSLDDLMIAACDWAMEAWCPEEGGPVRMRLNEAAERMARATRAESTEAILRQLPRTLPLAHGLKHPRILADPAFWRERLASLDAEAFGRISAAMTANILERLYLWDKQLGKH